MDIYVITGHLGSGKTEVAINFALQLLRRSQTGTASRIALLDVDVVNPYFAAREARTFLESQGIAVAAPSLQTTTADLPVLPKDIAQFLHREDHTVVIDVGGDPVGARVLGSLSAHLAGKTLHTYCVINTKRPSTSAFAGILAYIQNISAASRLRMTGLIHNTHLMNETSVQDILDGQALLEDVSRETGLPIVLTTVMSNLVENLRGLDTELLPMQRHIRPPYVL